MKKATAKRWALIGVGVLLVCVMLITLLQYTLSDKVVFSLGLFVKREFYSNGDFQDYTDYVKYHCVRARAKRNKYFSPVTEADITSLHAHLDDFEGWVSIADPTSDLATHYDFDRSIIDTQDYVYIHDEFMDNTNVFGDVTGRTLAHYDVYFLDSQTQILYYFHNNI